MNRVIAVIAVIVIAIIAFIGLKPEEDAKADYIRIHIRANSNGTDDQNVKYKVRDNIINYLIPILADCPDKRSVQAAVEKH